MASVIDVGSDRLRSPKTNAEQQFPFSTPRRVTDPTARAPIGASPADLAAATHAAVRIAGEPEQAVVMRRHLRTIAGTLRRELATIEFLASELFNNSLLYSRSGEAGGEITVVVITMPGRIQVKVLDQGPRPGQEKRPQVQPIAPEGASLPEGGFGLRLVDREATRWGVITERFRTTVWFDVDRCAGR